MNNESLMLRKQRFVRWHLRAFVEKNTALKEVSYADVSYLRTKIHYDLLRRSIFRIRGSRTLRRRALVDDSMGQWDQLLKKIACCFDLSTFLIRSLFLRVF